ncbi:MAG: aryl-sulfate sulfotransferase [Saprospiraceae bacterium]
MHYQFLLFIFFIISKNLLAQQTVGLFINEPSALNGYTLFGNNEKTYLIDNCGFQVNSWESDYNPGLSIYLLENGNLLRTAKISGSFSGGGLGGQFELFNWEGNLLWSYKYADNNVHSHHDIEPLPNGNFLAIAWEKHSQSDAQQNGRKHNGEVWSERIVEIEMIGNSQANIVWEWRLWDHLIQDHDSGKLNFGNIAQHAELVDINYLGDGVGTDGDWVHLNAISYQKGLDQIVVSSRNFSEIWIIDHSTSTAEAASHSGGNAGKGGDLLYRFGNPQAYQRGSLSDQLFFRQHDARWTLDGSQLSVFNNEFALGKSAVQIWTPPINSNGTYVLENNEPFGPDFFDWEYSANGFNSKTMSGAQHLPNGNLLICEADDGHLFELTKEKEIVWEYINPVNANGFPVSQGGTPLFNDLFRGTKYAVDYPAFIGKNLMPGAPIEINPWVSDCEIYLTETKDVTAGFYSGISINKNPTSDFLQVNSILNWEGIKVEVFNLIGHKIFQKEINAGFNKINIADLPAGIYLLVFKINKEFLFVEKIMKAN